ncbi:excalibur calcium-binding domain-containing protein [Mycolicibacterium sp. BiH015]|uniref:excalibur calcium-binding domain-containing protein n=1 Tax=Mycolicibacterium sp. BiH015 TaxID=3018808 RepID=UPI0022E40996|nr:excalibur calcium-binding domain-containing protein [Mycolicibacterium sp. BiH015]MDA2893346.1 excalibur calcium-binding domain-containing protein [Mycolicibacterium sp. BiH015]
MSTQQPLINSRTLIGAGVAAVVLLLVLVGSCGDGDDHTASPTTTVTRTVTATPAPVTITVTESASPPPAPPVVDQPPEDVPLPGTVIPPSTTTSTYAPVPLMPQMPTGAYYSSCAEARRAGAAPLYAGQPGYRAALDRDGDGVACE